MVNKFTYRSLISNVMIDHSLNQNDQSIVLTLMYHHSNHVKCISDFLDHQNDLIDFDQKMFINNLNKIVYDKIPIDRVVNKTFFCEQELIVHPNVFVPRHESELLVYTLIDKIKSMKLDTSSYIDVCAGSGCIGLMVKKQLPTLKLSLLDIAEWAINNIKDNCELLGIDSTIIQDDWLNHLNRYDYDIISANFPYVKRHHIIGDDLRKWEHDWSLFGVNDQIDHYDQLISWAKNNDKWKLIVLETSDHYKDMWDKVTTECSQWNWEHIKDLTNQLRVIVISNR